MRKRLIIGLTVLNGFLAIGILATPARTQVLPASALWDCCQGSGQQAYCCNNCCWLIQNCDYDDDCKDN